jgi:hypothetical protein
MKNQKQLELDFGRGYKLDSYIKNKNLDRSIKWWFSRIRHSIADDHENPQLLQELKQPKLKLDV